MLGPKLLSRYLARSKLSYPAFAEKVGADRARIHRCARGERNPSLSLAVAIEEATGGAVPASSWPKRPVRRLARKLARRSSRPVSQ
jgi:hypothetical protein